LHVHLSAANVNEVRHVLHAPFGATHVVQFVGQFMHV